MDISTIFIEVISVTLAGLALLLRSIPVLFMIIVILKSVTGQSKKRTYSPPMPMSRKEMADPWKKVAQLNGLTYTQDRQGMFKFRHVFVTGMYRGRFLKLTNIAENSIMRDNTTISLINEPLLTGQADRNQKSLIRLFALTLAHPQTGYKIKVEPNGSQIIYEQANLKADPEYLQDVFDLLSDIMDDYPAVLALGSIAIPALKKAVRSKPLLREVALQLLKDIATKSKQSLTAPLSHYVCPHCVRRFDKIRVNLFQASSVTYYGCPQCSQNQSYTTVAGDIIAVLDHKMGVEQEQVNNTLRVNWLVYRKYFNFDMVEIMAASDEEIERFAVQVGNNADLVRQARYKQMGCGVSPDCNLSANSMRILGHMFGSLFSY